MRHAAKRDATEKAVMRPFLSRGKKAIRCSHAGWPDFYLGAGRWVEVKADDGGLTPAQVEAFAMLEAAGDTIVVLVSERQAELVAAGDGNGMSWRAFPVDSYAKRGKRRHKPATRIPARLRKPTAPG